MTQRGLIGISFVENISSCDISEGPSVRKPTIINAGYCILFLPPKKTSNKLLNALTRYNV